MYRHCLLDSLSSCTSEMTLELIMIKSKFLFASLMLFDQIGIQKRGCLRTAYDQFGPFPIANHWLVTG